MIIGLRHIYYYITSSDYRLFILLLNLNNRKINTKNKI